MERVELQVGGLRFDAIAAGPASGERVLLLHGFPNNADAWAPVVRALGRAGLRAVAPSQRGYSPGARPPDRDDYRTEHLVEDVAGIAGALGWRRFHLVGHDWGGAVAWSFAARHPARLRSLAVVSTPHPAALLRAMTGTQALRSLYIGLFRTPRLPELLMGARGNLPLRLGLRLTGLDRASANRCADLLREPGALTAALNWYRGFDPRTAVATGQITVPTLYVWSTGDVALGRRAAEATAGYVDAPYRFVVLEGTSHWIPERSPGRLSRLLLEHIEVLPRRPRPAPAG